MHDLRDREVYCFNLRRRSLEAPRSGESSWLQVYALLHRQEVFAPFRSQQRFADLMENIFLVLDHFNAKVRRQLSQNSWHWLRGQPLALTQCNFPKAAAA